MNEQTLEMLARGVVTPTRPLHFEYVRLAVCIVGVALLATLPIAFSLAMFTVFPSFLFAAFAIASLFAGVPVVVLLRKAEDALDWYQIQAEKNMDTNRQVILARADVDITINGNRNRITVGDTQTNNALMLGSSLNETRAEFIRHYCEIIERAQFNKSIGGCKTGFEARLLLKNVPGGVGDYVFRDGKPITRSEYDQLMEFADKQGDAPVGRRRGSAGSPTLLEGEITTK